MAGPVKNKRYRTKSFSKPYQHHQSNKSAHQKNKPSKQDCQYYHDQLDGLLGVETVTYLSKRHESTKRLDTLVAIKPWLYRWYSNLNNIVEVAKKKHADQRLWWLYNNLDDLVEPNRSFKPEDVIKLLSYKDDNPDINFVDSLAQKHDRLLAIGFSGEQLQNILSCKQNSTSQRLIDIIYYQFARQLKTGYQLPETVTQQLLDLAQDPSLHFQIIQGRYDYLLKSAALKECSDNLLSETDSISTASSESISNDNSSLVSIFDVFSDWESVSEDSDSIDSIDDQYDSAQAGRSLICSQSLFKYPYSRDIDHLEETGKQAIQDQEEEYQKMLE